jgi:hypothetical protein
VRTFQGEEWDHESQAWTTEEPSSGMFVVQAPQSERRPTERQDSTQRTQEAAGQIAMNLKNIDWTHVALLVITVAIAIYNALIADGVTLPVQVGTVILMLTSIANLLRQSPVATPQQVASKTTRADMRALQINREDKTQ